METSETDKKPSNILEFVRRFPDEKACRDYLANSRWGDQPQCPHCGHMAKIYRINDGKLYKCAKCMKQFTVRVGTIFEDSALPLQKWFMAIYILTAHRKGISSCQLARDIEVTQKTAWFMLHRIRYAVKAKSFKKPLNGIVEIDETYVGGIGHGKTLKEAKAAKVPVFGMLERGGMVRAMPVARTTKWNLKPIIRRHISKNATIMSDTYGPYKDLNQEYKGHEVVDHSQKEYVRGTVHTNNIEGFWSLMKRGINGVYHHASRKHMHRYTDEYAYRYNSRKETDIDRFMEFLSNCDCRLTHKKLVG